MARGVDEHVDMEKGTRIPIPVPVQTRILTLNPTPL